MLESTMVVGDVTLVWSCVTVVSHHMVPCHSVTTRHCGLVRSTLLLTFNWSPPDRAEILTVRRWPGRAVTQRSALHGWTEEERRGLALTGGAAGPSNTSQSSAGSSLSLSLSLSPGHW